MKGDEVNVFWFRRDLRLEDNVGFTNAMKGKHSVLLVFIFDTEILNDLGETDPRVTFIFNTLQKMRNKLQAAGSSLAIYKGSPIEIYKAITSEFNVQNVITNRDYEPYALNRDEEVRKYLENKKIGFYTFKDQVIFEKDEIVKQNGDPYIVYTPYMKKWKEQFRQELDKKALSPSRVLKNLVQKSNLPNLTLNEVGFKKSKLEIPDYDVSTEIIQEYGERRNFPAQDATSHLGPHLRFGTVSIRKIIKKASNQSQEIFWQELIWREFFMQILWHFPETVNNAFKKKYDRIQWRNNKTEFESWREGKTGYPLVDAGMRQLNETGYMHNRVRMVVASFLCKHLLIDWRWGEAYFATKLLDYELSSNIGNWQWAAGSGVDAAPYFRIFNPTTQIEKFDKDNTYIKKWIPELESEDYPLPIVDHKEARERCLTIYKAAMG